MFSGPATSPPVPDHHKRKERITQDRGAASDEEATDQLVSMLDRLQRPAQARPITPRQPLDRNAVGHRLRALTVLDLLRQNEIERDPVRVHERIDIALGSATQTRRSSRKNG